MIRRRFPVIGTAISGETLEIESIWHAPLLEYLLHQSPTFGRPGAGPAIALSFLLVAFACGLAALCYAELASRIPIAGSAYTYTYATLGESEKAIEYYGLVESKHPEHSYADDARLLAAEEYRDLGKPDEERELLESLPATYPGGDMTTEALWRVAFRAYKDKKYSEAVSWLEKQIESAPIDDRFWAEGQAQYWIARSQAKRGKSKESVAAYREVIEHPDSLPPAIEVRHGGRTYPVVPLPLVEVTDPAAADLLRRYRDRLARELAGPDSDGNASANDGVRPDSDGNSPANDGVRPDSDGVSRG